jgi:pimeloyl-ACP methyl ester carboxylesterase
MVTSATPADELAGFVADVPYREVALPWGTTQVWDAGDGRPLVMLHGVAGGRRPFYRAVPLLAASRRVVVPLLRGEDRPVRRMTYPDLLDDLAALLERLDLEDATLFGASFGGTIALQYAARGDRRVRDVVVQGTFPRFRLRRFDRAAFALARLAPDEWAARYFGYRVRNGPEAKLLRACAPGLDVMMAEWSAKTPFRSLAQRTRLIQSMDLADDLRRIDVPLTLVQGGRDRVVPPGYFVLLCALCPGASVVRLDEAGHLPMLTHPAEFAALFNDPARRCS